MPIYEYQCINCSKTIEVSQKISDPPLTECEHCTGKLKKIISKSSFQLKGTGWYTTDYAKKTGGDCSEKRKKSPNKASDKTEKTKNNEKKKSDKP
ncbi:MAG: zinc ribbon domain-containing protein [Deltaproteobacteria bacterium]|nr:zinc ribbon domain-containing protein [Deltaproteobacteria bacterium]